MPYNPLFRSFVGLMSHSASAFEMCYPPVAADSGEQNLLLQHLESFLPGEASLSCDRPLTEDELLAAVRGMARSKASPGLDGVPLEFYFAFWYLLAPDLLTFRDWLFPISLGSAIITLLFKKGDRLNPRNSSKMLIIKFLLGPLRPNFLKLYIILVSIEPAGSRAASLVKMLP